MRNALLGLSFAILLFSSCDKTSYAYPQGYVNVSLVSNVNGKITLNVTVPQKTDSVIVWINRKRQRNLTQFSSGGTATFTGIVVKGDEVGFLEFPLLGSTSYTVK